MMEVRGLTCGYGGRPVVRRMEFRVEPGEVLGIVGPNGSGKSTLIRAMAGLLRPMAGGVTVEGRDVGAMGAVERARLMAVVGQGISFDLPFSCLETVVMGRYAHSPGLRGYSRGDWELARAALRRVGMEEKARRPAHRLSGGEMQLLALARALCQDTPFLLLDEPTSHLDLARRVEVFDLLVSLARQGRGVVCVIHDINLASLYCHRLLMIKGGEMAALGPPDALVTPEVMEEVFGARVAVAPHPLLGRPQIHLLPAEG